MIRISWGAAPKGPASLIATLSQPPIIRRHNSGNGFFRERICPHQRILGQMRSTSILAFLLLTFALAWTLWIAAAALSGGVAAPSHVPPGIRALIFLPGTFAPSLVALSLTARHEGRTGVFALLQRLFQWRVGLRWYVFAVLYMAAIKLTAALVHRVATDSWPRFGDTALYVMLAATIFSTVVGGQAGEEIGWRGYALPRMAARLGLAGASVLLGVIWAAWHLPLFFIAETDLTGQSFPVFLLAVTPLSTAMAWLYWRTNGSLLLTMLMHAAINNTTGIVPSSVTGAANPWALSTSPMAWLTIALLWIAAGYFLVRMPKQNSKFDLHSPAPSVMVRLG
jgi:membrane protease YdiL (CAAX protease family)